MARAMQSYENVSMVNVKEWLQSDIYELGVPCVTNTNCQLIKTIKVIMTAESTRLKKEMAVSTSVC
jgi:hypothetical protein